MDIGLIGCPRCGKKHFRKTGFSGEGHSYDFLQDFGISDCLHRIRPVEEYVNGELQNPEAFLPSPTRTRFECLECGCKFAVETQYKLHGNVEIIIDEDEEEKVRKEILAEAQKRFKQQTERAPKTTDELPITVSNITGDTILYTTDQSHNTLSVQETCASMQFGNGTKSIIDLGGVICKSNIVYTDEQIANIKNYFGWIVKNN